MSLVTDNNCAVVQIIITRLGGIDQNDSESISFG